MPAKGLLQPPGAAIGADLGVDEQRPLPCPDQPVPDWRRSSAARTVTASQPKPRPIAAMSAAGNLTVSSGCPPGPKWCTSAPYAASSYTTITIGRPNLTVVSSSLTLISAPPSPSAA